MNKIEAVIFDIDGTLADVDHRRHFVEGKKKDFDAFYDAMTEDSVRPDIRGLNKMCVEMGCHVIICTGRPQSYSDITIEWLIESDIHFDELYMRPDNERFRPDYEVKQSMLDSFKHKFKIHFAVDDRDQVVDMWRRNGITCLQVAEGNF